MPTLEAARSRRFRLTSRVMAALAALIGVGCVIGWMFGIRWLVALPPTYNEVSPLTGVAFLLAGASLWLLGFRIEPAFNANRRRWAITFAAALLLSGLGALWGRAGGWQWGIERLFSNAAPPPALMTISCLILLGTSLLLMSVRDVAGSPLEQWTAMPALAIAWMGIVNHLAAPAIDITGISLQAASGCFLLALATLFAQPDRGVMQLVTRDGPAGRVLRLLLPVAAALPIVITIARYWIENAGMLTRHEGGLLASLAFLTTLAVVIYGLARSLEAADRRRREAEATLLESFEQLRDRTEALTTAHETLREKYAAEQTLERSMRELSSQLMSLRDVERRKLARDLHDSTGQNLTALGLELFALQGATRKLTPEERASLQQAIQLTDQISRELRTFSYLLHPPMLDEAGLAAAVGWFVEGFEQRSGIRTTVEAPTEFPRLSGECELALFRVVQESLTNIHRHSGSPTAVIQLAAENGTVRLNVIDNGRGFPREILEQPEQSGKSGVGLRGMRERIRQLGGSLELSCNGQGSTLAVSLPLKAAAAGAAASVASASN